MFPLSVACNMDAIAIASFAKRHNIFPKQMAVEFLMAQKTSTRTRRFTVCHFVVAATRVETDSNHLTIRLHDDKNDCMYSPFMGMVSKRRNGGGGSTQCVGRARESKWNPIEILLPQILGFMCALFPLLVIIILYTAVLHTSHSALRVRAMAAFLCCETIARRRT